MDRCVEPYIRRTSTNSPSNDLRWMPGRRFRRSQCGSPEGLKRTDLRADAGGGSPGVEVVRELTKDSPSRWPKRKELALRVRVSANSAQTTPAMYNLRDYEDEARTFTCRKLESPPQEPFPSRKFIVRVRRLFEKRPQFVCPRHSCSPLEKSDRCGQEVNTLIHRSMQINSSAKRATGGISFSIC